MVQRNVEWYSVRTNSVVLREMGQRNVEWYSAHTNGVELREMAQHNVEWYSVHTNSVVLREMGRRNVEWYSVHTNSVAFAEHQTLYLNIKLLIIIEIFRCCGESLSLLVAWREDHAILLLAMLSCS